MELVTGQFNDSYKPIMDGVANVIHNYAYWLNRKYAKSVAVAPAVPGYADVEDYEVLRYSSLPLVNMPYRLGLPDLDIPFQLRLAEIPFQIVHAHSPFASGQIALQTARKRKIPLVCTFHSKYRDDIKSIVPADFIADIAIKTLLHYWNKADFMWVPNRATGKTLEEYGYSGPYEVMENGTDLLIPNKDDYQALRTEGGQMTGTDRDDFVLLFVGQHRWVKNIRLIIEGLEELRHLYHVRGVGKKPVFHLVMVGEGHEKAEIETMVEELGLTPYVRFLGLILDRDVLCRIYARADLFVFPSVYDNAPLVMREAAAFGVPSIVVEGANAAENIQDGRNGFLVNNSSSELAAKIFWLISHPRLVRHAGEEASRSVYIHWESIVDKVYYRYQDIIRDYRPRKKGIFARETESP